MAQLLTGITYRSVTATGQPNAFGKVYTYAAGTLTNQAVYTTAAGNVPQTNPVILDAAGTAQVWLDPALTYRIREFTALDVPIPGGDVDNVGGADIAGQLAASAGAGLVGYSATATYTAGTVGAWLQRSVFVADYGTDLTAVQTAIDACLADGGGIVVCAPGATYTGTALPIVKQGVLLEMNRATFNATLGTGNVYGLRLSSYSGVRNGTIAVTSSGTPSSQFIFHAAISLGEANSNGGTPASPSTFSTVRDFLVEDMTLSTTRLYTPALQGAGNLYNGVIRRITIPSNATCSGIHLDWSDIGSPVSSSNIAGTRAAFDAGNCYTTHPHGILIEDIACGALTCPASGDLGSSIVRLSACYNITVRNLQAETTTLTGFRNVGGDLGFEFALAGIKPMACKGITVDGVSILAPAATFKDGIYIDTLADNIYREQFTAAAYVPLMDPLMHADIRVTANLSGSNVASVYGARVTQARGVHLVGGSYQKFELGVWIDEFTQDCTVDGVLATANRLHGIRVGGDDLREDTQRVTVKHCRSYGNGTAGTGHGIFQARGIDCSYLHNHTGQVGEAAQEVGLVIADNALTFGTRADFNTDHGELLAGFSLPGTLAPHYFDQMASCAGNVADLSDPQAPIVVSQSFAVESSRMFGSRWAKQYVAINTTSDPTTGHWKKGSFIAFFDLVAGGNPGKSVTTSGSFGTLAGITNAATTNGSKTVQMTLAATTATFTAGAYSGTVASAANLRVGLVCTIAGGVTDARIIGLSGTTVFLNKPCKAVAGAAFTTSGVIEGEVVSINTTTPIAGAVVMNATGAGVVTLDTAAVDTQTGRAVTYTAPVFKAHAAIAA